MSLNCSWNRLKVSERHRVTLIQSYAQLLRHVRLVSSPVQRTLHDYRPTFNTYSNSYKVAVHPLVYQNIKAQQMHKKRTIALCNWMYTFLLRVVSTLTRDWNSNNIISIRPSACLSVCPSVRPWHSGIRWKRFNIIVIVFTARCDASAVFSVMQCLSVRPSVHLSATFVDHVKTNKHMFEIFSPPGRDTILVLPPQRGCRYSDGNPLMGASNARGL